jgi:hypothetical protein
MTVNHKVGLKSYLSGFFALYILSLTCMLIYFYGGYEVKQWQPNQLIISTTVSNLELVVYAKNKNDSEIDFNKPLLPKLLNGQLSVDLLKNEIRNFRIYFGKTNTVSRIHSVRLVSNLDSLNLNMNLFTQKRILLKSKTNEGLEFVPSENAYLELKRDWINALEFRTIIIIILLMGLILSGILLYLSNQFIKDFIHLDIKSKIVSLFPIAIFLPHPWYNFVFIFSFLVVVKDFQFSRFIKHRQGLLLILYFFIFLVVDVFFSETFNVAIIETFLPLFFLPFYAASVPRFNHFRLLPFATLLFCLFFYSSSIIDCIVFHNLNYLSFDLFTKYIHPVYFSYLLFFNLLYIELCKQNLEGIFWFRFIFLIALLFCGSKLVLLLLFGFYLIYGFKKNWKIFLSVAVIMILSLFVFNPTKIRFAQLLHNQSFSILKESPVQNPQDVRLNSLTLRLIIWQECFHVFKSTHSYMFGFGLDEHADSYLRNRLELRGLKRGLTKYDPHNQYITTYYKTGLIGLLVLLGICFYGLKTALKQHHKLIIYCYFFFIIVMLAESVLQRVVGIYFFASLILLLPLSIDHQMEFQLKKDIKN